jgi:hypothetical protein
VYVSDVGGIISDVGCLCLLMFVIDLDGGCILGDVAVVVCAFWYL